MTTVHLRVVEGGSILIGPSEAILSGIPSIEKGRLRVGGIKRMPILDTIRVLVLLVVMMLPVKSVSHHLWRRMVSAMFLSVPRG